MYQTDRHGHGDRVYYEARDLNTWLGEETCITDYQARVAKLIYSCNSMLGYVQIRYPTEAENKYVT